MRKMKLSENPHKMEKKRTGAPNDATEMQGNSIAHISGGAIRRNVSTETDLIFIVRLL